MRGKKTARLAKLFPLVGFVIALLAIPADRSAAESPFRKLSGKEIGSTIIGKQITDDVHWTDTYQKDGKILSLSMGVERHAGWKIEGDQLCLQDYEADGCYEIWVRGDEVQFRSNGKEIMNLTGIIRAP